MIGLWCEMVRAADGVGMIQIDETDKDLSIQQRKHSALGFVFKIYCILTLCVPNVLHLVNSLFNMLNKSIWLSLSKSIWLLWKSHKDFANFAHINVSSCWFIHK